MPAQMTFAKAHMIFGKKAAKNVLISKNQYFLSISKKNS